MNTPPPRVSHIQTLILMEVHCWPVVFLFPFPFIVSSAEHSLLLINIAPSHLTVRGGKYKFFVNADETPVRLEDCPRQTVETKGKKRVVGRTAGKEKFCLTALLMIGVEIIDDFQGQHT